LSKSSLTLEQENVVRAALSTCIKLDHNQSISNIAINIRKKYNLKLPDAIIAATAELYGIPLLTVDKGFSKIKDFNCLIIDL
jgi:predicted nucleic acid-binding protein